MTDRHLAPVLTNVEEPYTEPGPGDWTPPQANSTHQPPHDRDAEQATIGAILGSAILGSAAPLEELTRIVQPADFYDLKHELIYSAIVTLYSQTRKVDKITVAHQLGPDLSRAGGRVHLEQLTTLGIGVGDATWHAHIVAEHAALRRLQQHHLKGLAEIEARGTAGADELYQRTAERLEQIPRGVPGVDEHTAGEDIDTFLAGDDPEYAWLIPGLIERQDRLILTAGEGRGKSTLCRQIAVQTATGIHPFTNETIDPIRVLLVDLENTRRQSRRKLRPLRLQAGHRLDPANLVIECHTGGIDLTQPQDRAWLRSVVAEHRPDLLITGPIYKMASGDTDKEKDSKPVALAIDALRDEFDMAVILEAHTRKAEGTDTRKRAKEPIGWSGWMRWPEFGLHLSDDGEVTHWRGARDERTWPHQLTRGGAWPWSASMTIANQNWIRIRQAIRNAGRKLTARELEDATGLGKSTVNRTMQDHSLDLAQLYFDLEMEG